MKYDILRIPRVVSHHTVVVCVALGFGVSYEVRVRLAGVGPLGANAPGLIDERCAAMAVSALDDMLAAYPCSLTCPAEERDQAGCVLGDLTAHTDKGEISINRFLCEHNFVSLPYRPGIE